VETVSVFQMILWCFLATKKFIYFKEEKSGS